jgi:hypothetical protein
LRGFFAHRRFSRHEKIPIWHSYAEYRALYIWAKGQSLVWKICEKASIWYNPGVQHRMLCWWFVRLRQINHHTPAAPPQQTPR